MKHCEMCGCRLEKVGCINCDDNAYLDHQDMVDDWSEKNRKEYSRYDGSSYESAL